MTKPPFPQTIYLPFGHYGREGWDPMCDSRASLADACDEVIDVMDRRYVTEWRVMRIDFDPDTGEVERSAFVDDDAVADMVARFDEDELPEWLGGKSDWDADDYREAAGDFARAAE